MKFRLTLNKIIDVDTDDPRFGGEGDDVIRDALRDSQEDNTADPATASPAELHDAVRYLLENDMDVLFDVSDIDENDFEIAVLDKDGNPVVEGGATTSRMEGSNFEEVEK